MARRAGNSRRRDVAHQPFAPPPADPAPPATASAAPEAPAPRVRDLVARSDRRGREAAAAPDAPVSDITREAPDFPSPRDARLQTLARGDEGFLLCLAYSTQRGYGRTHPFVGEIRYGEVEVELFVGDLGFAVPLGDVSVTECQMVNQFSGRDGSAPRFTRGYGLVFGQSERKAMAMALVDRALRADEFAEERKARSCTTLLMPEFAVNVFLGGSKRETPALNASIGRRATVGRTAGNGRRGGVPARRRKPGLRPERASTEAAADHREGELRSFEPATRDGRSAQIPGRVARPGSWDVIAVERLITATAF